MHSKWRWGRLPIALPVSPTVPNCDPADNIAVGAGRSVQVAADVGGAVISVQAELEAADRTLQEKDRPGHGCQDGRPYRCEEIVALMEPSSGARESPVVEIVGPGTGQIQALTVACTWISCPTRMRLGSAIAVGGGQSFDRGPVVGGDRGQAFPGGDGVDRDARSRSRFCDESRRQSVGGSFRRRSRRCR